MIWIKHSWFCWLGQKHKEGKWQRKKKGESKGVSRGQISPWKISERRLGACTLFQYSAYFRQRQRSVAILSWHLTSDLWVCFIAFFVHKILNLSIFSARLQPPKNFIQLLFQLLHSSQNCSYIPEHCWRVKWWCDSQDVELKLFTEQPTFSPLPLFLFLSKHLSHVEQSCNNSSIKSTGRKLVATFFYINVPAP